MARLPQGTVTLVFSDVEGSTRLLTRLGEQYADVLDTYRRLMRAGWASGGGVEMGTEGDGFYVAFGSAADAVGAAIDAQRRMATEEWAGDERVRVRIGMHTGEPMRHGDAYVGLDVHRAARIAAAAAGGQTLLSSTTRSLLGDSPRDITLTDLGLHRLKDFPDPMRLFQAQPAEFQDATFPQPRSLGSVSGVPSLEQPVLGRSADLTALSQLLLPGALITLTGAGGVGKTTLAIAIATEVGLKFEDGVHFVSLASARAGGAIWGELARTMDVQNWIGDPGQLLEAIKDRQILLVLDNLEQIADASVVVRELHSSARRACVVITSRRPMHVLGEREYPVASLGLASTKDFEAIRSSPATDLFVRVATTVLPSFRLDRGNAADIAAVCARVDGLPLAIELAASRSKLLTPRALRQRLEAGSQLLNIGDTAQGRPQRHQSLRETIRGSYDLLESSEQSSLRRLSPLHGGDLHAVSAAVGLANEQDPIDTVATLCDASLLEVSSGPDGQPRIRMLEAVRAFGLEQLDQSHEADATRRRLADHFAQAISAVGQRVGQSGGYSWARDRLDQDLDNVREALVWALAPEGLEDVHRAETALSLAVGMARVWGSAGYYEEVVDALEGAIARAQGRDIPGLAEALSLYADRARGTVDDCIATARQALALFRAHGDICGAARSLVYIGFATAVRDASIGVARSTLIEAHNMAHAARDDPTLAFVCEMYGNLEHRLGDLEQAGMLYQQALEAAQRAGDEDLYLACENDMALLYAMTGKATAARERLNALAPLIMARGDRMGALELLYGYSATHAVLGNARLAAKLQGAAEQLRFHELGMPTSQSDAELLERSLACARPLLAEAEWESHRREGARLTVREAVDEALAH